MLRIRSWSLLLDDVVGRRLQDRHRNGVRVLQEIVAPGLGVIVHALTGAEAGLDDGGVWGYDERLHLLGRVEHLAMVPEAQCPRTFLAAVALVEVNNEADHPCKRNCATGHNTGDSRGH